MSCLTCEHLVSDSKDDYGSNVYNYCDKTNFGNLKSFPFKKVMSCFQLNFWHSEFSEMVNGDLEGSYETAMELYSKKYLNPAQPDKG